MIFDELFSLAKLIFVESSVFVLFVFPVTVFHSITKISLPAELIPKYTTIEYTLARPALIPPKPERQKISVLKEEVYHDEWWLKMCCVSSR